MTDALEAVELLARMAGEKADAYPTHIEEEIHNEIVRARGVIEAALTTPRITIQYENGNTVSGAASDVLNHGHLKDGWHYITEAELAALTERRGY